MNDTITFRVDPELKAAITEMAQQQDKSVGELLRELVRDRLKRRQRLAFEAEAHRQCLLLNEAARDPTSDEAQVMRELEADLAEFGEEWT